ncbi:MAG: hypothetical protein C0475_00300 [Planctomyces sp.]|nr:hypothetical protein [Planctomyces sp.]
MASNACWGVEVGSSELKAIKLVRQGEGVAVADFLVVPHKRVLSAPDVDKNDAMRVAIGTLVSQRDMGKARLAISVPGNSAFARFAKLPPVEAKRVPDIVKFEAVQQIPFPIDDVQWDYQTFVSQEPEIAPGLAEIEVGIFALTTDRVNENLSRWADVEKTPDVLTLSPLAVYNAMAYDLSFTPGMPGTVIVDVGTTSTDLIVAEGGRLWIRTFQIGGHQFTEAVATTFNISYNKAEKLKREAESSQHARQILQAMRPVFADLAQEVQRSIGYYTSLHKGAKLSRLIGLGATFALPGLRKFLSQQLTMEVSRLEGFERAAMAGERAAELKTHAVTLATAYGLALQGLGETVLEANLMPLRLVRKAMWREKTPWFVGAAGLALVAGGVTFARPLIDGQNVPAKPAVIDATKGQLQGLKSEWQRYQEEYKPDPRATAAIGLLSGRDVMPRLVQDVSDMFAAAQRSAPGSVPADLGGPVIAFAGFEAEYIGGKEPPPLGGGGPGGGGGGGGAGAGGAGGAGGDAPPADGVPVEAVATPRRIALTLRVQTALPESGAEQLLIRDSFLRWIQSNAARQGVPYVLDPRSFGFALLGTVTGGDGQARSGRERDDRVPPPGPPDDPRGRPGTPRGDGAGSIPPPDVLIPTPPGYHPAPTATIRTYAIRWIADMNVPPPAPAEGTPDEGTENTTGVPQ